HDGEVTGYAVYTPTGSEKALRSLLPAHFRLLLQGEGDLGARLLRATADLLDLGHAGAILLNADSPTLPAAILRAAVDAVRSADAVVLSPALDVDDAQTLRLLESELDGAPLSFAAPGLTGADAPATRQFLARRNAPLRVGS